MNPVSSRNAMITAPSKGTADAMMAALSYEMDLLLTSGSVGVSNVATEDALSNTCPDFVLGQSIPTLDEPIILGSSEGDILGVLLPGDHNSITAFLTATAAFADNGIPIDISDPTLIANISRPAWTVLHACANPAHEFHPQAAAHGAETAGAVRTTFISFSHA